MLLPVTAQGIVVFMVFGAGLTAGLLAQIGNAIDSDSLHTIGRVASWALPFEGLYAAGLHALISGTSGLTGVVLQLGPFGGSEAGRPGADRLGLRLHARRAGAGGLRLLAARSLNPAGPELPG